MSFVERAGKYADDVVAGTIPACLYVKQACQRFIDDLARDDLERDWPTAEMWCENLEKLPHVKGRWAARGELLKLSDWQIFCTVNIFGWKKGGKRRFVDVYIEVPRKNGKTFWIAGLGIGMLTWAAEHGAEVYCGATTELQAWEVFRPARQLCLQLPKLRKTYGIEVNAKSLVRLGDLSRFTPLVGNPGDGASPSCGIVDEFHEHKDDGLVSTLETGMAAREEPLMLHITTAGADMGGPCYDKRADVINILKGAADDDRVFGIIYTIDEDDDWDTVEAQIKANPNYGISVYAEFLEGQLKQARRSPSKQAAYKTKHLNQWVGAKAAWMNMLAYQACRKKNIDIKKFKGQRCFPALDFASRSDLACMSLLFPPSSVHPRWAAFVKHYLPEDTINDRPRYQGFHAGGWLTSTPGNRIDFEYIEEDLKQTCKDYDVDQVAFDPFHATQFVTRMQAEGINMVEVGMTFKYFSDPMKELDSLIATKQIDFTYDPVLTWAFGNVVAKTTINKAKEVILPDKEKPENKIDPVVALIMSLNRALPFEIATTSVYESRGILNLDINATDSASPKPYS